MFLSFDRHVTSLVLIVCDYIVKNDAREIELSSVDGTRVYGVQGLVAWNGDMIIHFLREQFLSSGSDILRSTEADVKSVCVNCVVPSEAPVHQLHSRSSQTSICYRSLPSSAFFL
jgi:hypothetical protein